MLIRADDLPIHQTFEPLSYLATSERNTYERYLFNGYSSSGEFYFGAAFGIYPHLEVMDCSLSVVTASGTQESYHASRRCPADRTETAVGPFTLTLVKPMQRLRITLSDNPTGMTADLLFEARTVACEEPADDVRRGARVIMRNSRYLQFGTWSGSITIDGARTEVHPARAFGIRDRSWGWRQVGEPETGGGSHKVSLTANQRYNVWAPVHWQGECSVWGSHEDADGNRYKGFAQSFPTHPVGADFDVVDATEVTDVAPGGHRLVFIPGTRYVSKGEYETSRGNSLSTVSFDTGIRFHMLGLGYFHPTWGHGMWHGEFDQTREAWRSDELDPKAPENLHVQYFASFRDEEGHDGWGTFEQFIFGPHAPHGLTGLVDPAMMPNDKS